MNEEEIKYQRVKKRVDELKDFYLHLFVYILVNMFLFLFNIITSPSSLWFYWPLLGWGIAIVFHAFSIFGFDQLLGSDWEEKKIREIMEKDNKD